MLDVAIGVVFVYLLLSLIASAAAEAWEAFFKRRAIDLERGIIELLRDKDLAASFYEHPLINGLYKGDFKKIEGAIKENLSAWRGRSAGLPSYIPTRTFALAIMDMLVPDSHGTTPPTVPAAGAAPPAARAMLAPMNVAAPAEVVAPPADDPSDQARRAVALLIKAADGDAEQARKNIEDWYNAAMDRVSGWYKRRTQVFLFAIGMIIAIVLNVDSIRVVTALSTDKPKRDSVVQIATAYAKANPPKSDTAPATTTSAPPTSTSAPAATKPVAPPTAGNATATTGSAAAPVKTTVTVTATTDSAAKKSETPLAPATASATTTAAATTTATSTTASTNATAPAKETPPPPVAAANDHTKAALDQLDKLGLPIGWKNYGCALCEPPIECKIDAGDRGWLGQACLKSAYPHWVRCWFLIFAGWLITALAISLGAPFWFDTLNKLIVVRSTVKPQEKSGTEAPKDPPKKS